MTQKVTEAEFLNAWRDTGGSAVAVAGVLGLSERAVHGRRRRIESLKGIPLLSTSNKSPDKHLSPPPGRFSTSIENGTVLVGSDVHIWPGHLSTAQRGFIHLAQTLKPSIICINGDLFDGARISRFPAGSWDQEHRPSVKAELEACQAFTKALEAIPGALKVWTIGNHDLRFEARLASLTPEYEGVPGFALKDHWPEWKMCVSLWLNNSCVIKHRWKGGLHAPHRNTVESGVSFVTGHLHSAKVMPWTDYNGDRYGVDCGTLAEVFSRQFDYVEDNPRNWRSAFAVLTFKDGKLLMPELAMAWDAERIQFRGDLISV